ncbi:hypothetical protein E2544_08865 [Achromobacter insolitus]|uniref:hypothetical protein n=1 Tax=Achromobacter insolitus TaxID=217204 RepID=UPI0011EAEB37|nr:hypothetical protein [Achromobacter insolitus]QEK91914.1 hypothetical protein E2544_08865 [Achromobacter insolitus]GLK92390.1 hypothetical protein GCM10008164_01260 [Achromobacter xylosoxidans]
MQDDPDQDPGGAPAPGLEGEAEAPAIEIPPERVFTNIFMPTTEGWINGNTSVDEVQLPHMLAIGYRIGSARIDLDWFDWSDETVKPREANPAYADGLTLHDVPVGCVIVINKTDYRVTDAGPVELEFDVPGPYRILVAGMASYLEKEIIIP